MKNDKKTKYLLFLKSDKFFPITEPGQKFMKSPKEKTREMTDSISRNFYEYFFSLSDCNIIIVIVRLIC